MTEFAQLSQRLGATPGKLGLIAVLGVVLAVVLLLQSSGGSAELVGRANAEGQRGPERNQSRTTNRSGESKSAAAAAVEVELERLEAGMNSSRSGKLQNVPSLASVIAYDPFAVPSRFPQPAPEVPDVVAGTEETATDEQLTSRVAELQMQLETLRQRGVQVIIREGDGYAAMIGDRTVHVGDEINGFTVTAIEPNGVRVERNVKE